MLRRSDVKNEETSDSNVSLALFIFSANHRHSPASPEDVSLYAGSLWQACCRGVGMSCSGRGVVPIPQLFAVGQLKGGNREGSSLEGGV